MAVMHAEVFLVHLQSWGRYAFSSAEASAAIGGSDVAVRHALLRLKKKGTLATPFRGFHVIVPPEYRSLGCLPPDEWVPDLMAHLGETYYAGLLTAAEYHGAAHQRPQTFQVVTPKARTPLRCGRARVELVMRWNAAKCHRPGCYTSLPNAPRDLSFRRVSGALLANGEQHGVAPVPHTSASSR